MATKTKTEELHNYPFDASIFRNTFNGYVGKFNTIFATLIILISAPFAARVIAWYLELTGVDITGFLNVWYALGLSNISYELISSGTKNVKCFLKKCFGFTHEGGFSSQRLKAWVSNPFFR